MPRLSALAALVALGATPRLASAQERLELTQISDLSMFEAVLPVNRDYRSERGPTGGYRLTLGGGVSHHGRALGSGPAVAATLAVGTGFCFGLIGARSDLWGSVPGGEAEGPTSDRRIELDDLRGRHRLVAVLGWGGRREAGGRLVIDGGVQHSGRQPLRLQTAAFGTGRQAVATGSAEAAIKIGEELLDDDSISFHVEAEGSAVRWLDDGPAERATTGALSMGFGSIVTEREAVRGRIDLIRAGVAHTRVEPAPAVPTAGGAIGGNLGEIRSVHVRAGVDELTMYERELLGTLTAYAGWRWQEADTATRQLRDDQLELKLAANFKVAGRESVNRIGIGIGREPTHAADGQRLIADHRVELSFDHETRRLDLGARGALSWLVSTRGGAGPADEAILRYGSQLEGFVKLPMGFQAGAYQASSFEPQMAWDPWEAQRTWNVEAGLMLRWKGTSERERPRHSHAYIYR
jgi:hypothetical protein